MKCIHQFLFAKQLQDLSKKLKHHCFLLFPCKYACLRFYYYTAGSGGAGPTILATSFLLLGEEVVAYNKGQFQHVQMNYSFSH
jgi:hypothetical protein